MHLELSVASTNSLPLLMAVMLSLFHLPSSSGLRCYTCSWNKGDADDLCLVQPTALGRITDCDKKYCTIVRQEAVKPREVVSFVRGCEEKPIFLNKVIEDFTYKTYFRSCVTDLCNSADGLSSRETTAVAANNTIIAGRSGAASLTAGGVALMWVVGLKALL